MTTWFTADLHFGHRNIIDYCGRPFADVTAMNDALIRNWTMRVKPSDDVFVIGDLAMGKLDYTLRLAADLPGHKYLIPGNHDRCWRGHSRYRIRDVAMYETAGFDIMPSQMHLPLYVGPQAEPTQVLLCHFPYERDERHGARYAEHHPKDHGEWLIHGHIHNGHWQVKDRQINVGVDEWNFAPVSEDQIREIIFS